MAFRRPRTIDDPGIGLRFDKPVDRLLGADGQFRVDRRGGIRTVRQFFLFLTTVSTATYVLCLVGVYLAVILLFGAGYMAVGVDQLQGAELHGLWPRWRSALGFSMQTLTTVGYGHLAPMGNGAWLLATLESMLGVLGLGLFSAITYARIARPTARLLFSDRALIAPFREGWSLQFRVANRRDTLLMDVEARVLLVLADQDGQGERLNYYQLPLQLDRITFLPLTWTVVHPIDGDSPLAGLGAEELTRRRAELIVIVKGLDESYGQPVQTRRSYRWDEVHWGGRFERAFEPAGDGGMRLHLERVHAFEPVQAPDQLPGH